jgi:glycosyltransferase involved in cell wall biosynthesis
LLAIAEVVMKASVIIPAYNASGSIEACLNALLHQTVPRSDYEIIVVDDGATDRTREIIEEYPDVRLLSQPNRGPAAARNLGVSHAKGELALFTDADCVPSDNWIEAITEPFADPEIAGAKGAYRTGQKELMARFVQIEYESKYDKMSKDRYIDFVDTYSAAYRKTVFANDHGFDPVFPMASGEDVEFSYRLAREGHKMVFVPGAVVYHRHVDSILRYWCRKYHVGYWRVMMYRKHPQKMIDDSHTPQLLKVQVGLSLLLLVVGIGSIFWRGLVNVALAILVLFLASTVPFSLKAIKRDLGVGLISPLLLLLRALALGLGLVKGAWDLLCCKGKRNGHR